MKWRPYHGDRLIAEHPSGFVVIKPKDHVEPVPLCCPVCDHVMRTRDDEVAYLEHLCCERCAMLWVYPNKERWSKGWRPNSTDLAEAERSRPPLSIAFVVD